MRHALWLVLALAVQLATSRAQAQPHPPGTGPQRWDTLLPGQPDGLRVVRTTWTGRSGSRPRTARVELLRVGEIDGHESRIATVYSGAPVLTAAAARNGAVAIVAYNGGDAPFVRVLTVDLADARHPAVHSVTIDGIGDAGFRPARAVATADDQGLAVMWQQTRVPAGAATTAYTQEALTTLGRITAAGTWLAPPHRIEAPWSIGALAWNGHGYDLALRFDGAAANATRVCMVTLSPEGVPQQHPWWISPPEALDAITLVPTSRGTWVVWRNETAGQLEATLSTGPQTWGREVSAPTPRGPSTAAEAFGAYARPSDDTILELVRLPLPSGGSPPAR